MQAAHASTKIRMDSGCGNAFPGSHRFNSRRFRIRDEFRA
jgi:hypothetical protein